MTFDKNEEDRIADEQLNQRDKSYFLRTIVVALEPEEAQALAEVIDLATKAGGIQVAKVTVRLMDRLMEAVNAAKKDESTE